MKRTIIFGLAAGFVIVVFGGFDPVDLKPVIEKTWQWDLTGKYYSRIKMPDGIRVEFKSDRPLTAEQWKKKADEFYKAIKDQPQEEICPTCGNMYHP